MAVKLARLKEHPLMSPPQAEQSPLLELKPHQIAKMREWMADEAAKGDWLGYMSAADHLRALGLSVDVRAYEPQIRRSVLDMADKEVWTNFAGLAVRAARLGVDMRGDVKERMPEIAKYMQEEIHSITQHWADPMFIALDLKELGIPSPVDFKKHIVRIRSNLDEITMNSGLRGFVGEFSAAVALGLDVSQEVDAHKHKITDSMREAVKRKDWVHFTDAAQWARSWRLDIRGELKSHWGDMKKPLDEYEREGAWDSFSHHFVTLHMLGMTTPRTGGEMPLMPQLKRFRG